MLRFVPEPPQAESQTATEEVAPVTTEETQAPVAEAETPSTDVGAEVATPETETAAEETTDQVLSNSTSLTPEQQELLNKRVGKEVAKTRAIKEQYETKLKAAEAKLAEQEARLAAAPAPSAEAVPVVAAGPQPLSHVNDVPALMKLREDALNAIDFVEETLEDPNRWVDNPNGEGKVTMIGDRAYTEADLKASRRTAKATIDRQIPARLQFLSAKNTAQQQAFQKFPFLKDKTSPEYQQAQAAYRENSWLHGLPNADEIIGYQILGRKAEAERQAAAQAAPVEKPKPKVISAKPSNDQAAVSSNGAATRTPGSGERTALAALRTKLDAKGAITADDAKSLLLASDQARRSR
jgi:hypothetical protein